MSAPDRIWCWNGDGIASELAERPKKKIRGEYTEYLRRDGETVTALVEALRRAMDCITRWDDRTGPCVRQIDAALAKIKAEWTHLHDAPAPRTVAEFVTDEMEG